MQARLIKGIQKPRPEFETVGACLIMLHGISDTGANFECWYVEFLGHQEQHLDPNTSVGRSWHRWRLCTREGGALVVDLVTATSSTQNPEHGGGYKIALLSAYVEPP